MPSESRYFLHLYMFELWSVTSSASIALLSITYEASFRRNHRDGVPHLPIAVFLLSTLMGLLSWARKLLWRLSDRHGSLVWWSVLAALSYQIMGAAITLILAAWELSRHKPTVIGHQGPTTLMPVSLSAATILRCQLTLRVYTGPDPRHRRHRPGLEFHHNAFIVVPHLSDAVSNELCGIHQVRHVVLDGLSETGQAVACGALGACVIMSSI